MNGAEKSEKTTRRTIKYTPKYKKFVDINLKKKANKTKPRESDSPVQESMSADIAVPTPATKSVISVRSDLTDESLRHNSLQEEEIDIKDELAYEEEVQITHVVQKQIKHNVKRIKKVTLNTAESRPVQHFFPTAEKRQQAHQLKVRKTLTGRRYVILKRNPSKTQKKSQFSNPSNALKHQLSNQNLYISVGPKQSTSVNQPQISNSLDGKIRVYLQPKNSVANQLLPKQNLLKSVGPNQSNSASQPQISASSVGNNKVILRLKHPMMNQQSPKQKSGVPNQSSSANPPKAETVGNKVIIQLDPSMMNQPATAVQAPGEAGTKQPQLEMIPTSTGGTILVLNFNQDKTPKTGTYFFYTFLLFTTDTYVKPCIIHILLNLSLLAPTKAAPRLPKLAPKTPIVKHRKTFLLPKDSPAITENPPDSSPSNKRPASNLKETPAKYQKVEAKLSKEIGGEMSMTDNLDDSLEQYLNLGMEEVPPAEVDKAEQDIEGVVEGIVTSKGEIQLSNTEPSRLSGLYTT